MGKANWVKVNPASGSGSRDVQVSSVAEHTGREVRTSVLTFRAADCVDVVRTVNQAGKPENVSIQESAAVEKAGKLITISGQSNSAKLTFSLGTGDLELNLPSEYTANSVKTQNGVLISGDPGAKAVYPFSIQFNVPANETIESHSRQIIVTDEGGHTDTCTLTIAAGDAYLTVAEGTIELSYQGTPVSVHVDSNTSWTIS